MYRLKKYKILSIDGKFNYEEIVEKELNSDYLVEKILVVEEIGAFFKKSTKKKMWIQHGGTHENGKQIDLNPIISNVDCFVCCHPEFYKSHPLIEKHVLKKCRGKIILKMYQIDCEEKNTKDIILFMQGSYRSELQENFTQKCKSFLKSYYRGTLVYHN